MEVVDATLTGDIGKLRTLISQGVNIDVANRYGYTPLMIACDKGLIGVAKFLVAHGAKVNGTKVNGVAIHTPLNLAARKSLELVKFLLKNGANPNEMSRGGQTALFSAIQWSSDTKLDTKNIIKELLKYGANVNERDSNGSSPLLEAVSQCNEDIVKTLIKRGAKVNVFDKNGSDPLAWAARNHCGKIIKILRENGAVSNPNTSLMAAVETLDINGIKKALKRGANVNYTDKKFGGTPMSLIIESKHNLGEKIKIVDVLLEYGADPHKKLTEMYKRDTPMTMARRTQPVLADHMIRSTSFVGKLRRSGLTMGITAGTIAGATAVGMSHMIGPMTARL